MAKKLTPMLEQYMTMKEQYPDCLLFFRLGDFYEMFFEDALVASRELEIVLTARNAGQEEKAPMCGVPYHAVDNYVKRLIDKGYKVAICEQLSEPGKGLVERDVVRIITPGTVIEENMVAPDRNNYILCVHVNKGKAGISYADVSAGEFYATDLKDAATGVILDAIASIAPSEILVASSLANAIGEDAIRERGILITQLATMEFDQEGALARLKKHFGVGTLSGFGFRDDAPCIAAAGALLQYLYDTQKIPLDHMNRLIPQENAGYMQLDAGTKRNLELTQSMMQKGKRGSLLWVLDRTKSSAGARMLRRWIEQPLMDQNAIERRLDAVQALKENYICRVNLIDCMERVYDIERLCAKIAYGTVNARDVKAIGKSLSVIPEIQDLLTMVEAPLLAGIREELDALPAVYELIDRAIAEEPPLSVKEGGLLKAGYNEEVDRLREASTHGREWLAQLEARERESTGIKNLKVGYNKVFGYYIEVTKSQYELVPYRYTRKQTLANAERYITEELKEIEDTILGAEERSMRLEYQLFTEIRERLGGVLAKLQENARLMATVDVLCAFALCAYENDYTRPSINTEGRIHLVESRHPVVEKSMRGFVPNDCEMDLEENRFLIITGPNMSGKSTYMRQVAINALMAHIGSFIPAKEGDIALVDRIFTRVGASDDLASGRSTFMVEMVETANILNNATQDSLILLDEIGRGTSTFDGLSIAWAVAEEITKMGAKAMFATHYHELSEMEKLAEGVKNYCILAREEGDDIVFLHRIVRGGTDKSFGIQVARLAGVPDGVVERAKEVLEELRKLDVDGHILGQNREEGEADFGNQQSLFDSRANDFVEKVRHMEVDTLTPIQALNLLYEMKRDAEAID
ncbi:DNA mismatch repair protein MutS [Eubacteriales bacterium OttesenSCG-928-M02]|nr:DNA mismatch repair protein MutS [Eubacteriales bacterium OttesenSCG-928-M02]